MERETLGLLAGAKGKPLAGRSLAEWLPKRPHGTRHPGTMLAVPREGELKWHRGKVIRQEIERRDLHPHAHKSRRIPNGKTRLLPSRTDLDRLRRDVVAGLAA